MKINFRNDEKLEMNQREYIEEYREAFDKDLEPNVTLCAAKWFFEVNNTVRKLDKERTDTFHSIIAKLIWISQKGQPYICVPISFYAPEYRILT